MQSRPTTPGPRVAQSNSSSRPTPSFALRDATPVLFPGPPDIFGLLAWDQRGEIPVYTRQHMSVSSRVVGLNMVSDVSLRRLEILIPHRSQFSMDFHYVRWRRAILLSSTDGNSLHPSLVYAIALAAASLCASPAFQPYEVLFRSHAESFLEDSLAYADRVEDSMWARVILAWHSVRHGKHMQVSARILLAHALPLAS